jgi:hypothetical protein
MPETAEIETKDEPTVVPIGGKVEYLDAKPYPLVTTKPAVVSMRDLFKGNQLQVWDDFCVFTLLDLVKYLKHHPPSELLAIKYINVRTLGLAVLACHDHGHQLNRMWEKWYLDYTSKHEDGKIWIREVNQRKEAGVFRYGLGGESKERSLEQYRDYKRDALVAQAEQIITYFLSRSGVPFDPQKTLQAFSIPFKTEEEAAKKLYKYWDIVVEAGRMEEVRRIAGCNLDVVFTEAVKSLQRCMTEKKVIWAYIRPQKCPFCKENIKFEKKVDLEIDVTRENVAAARELVRIGQSIEAKKATEIDNVPGTPEEAFEQLAEAVARIIKASNLTVDEFQKKVEERLAA